jgi:general secretion pathway protein A
MYQNYWRLSRRPFETGIDPAVYYPVESQQASLLKLRYTIEHQRGGALLAGSCGLGKTLLVRLLATQLSDQFRPFVHLVFPQMSTAELLAYLADELHVGLERHGASDREPSIEASVRGIERRLLDNASEGRHAVVIVDEAHLIDGARTFEALRLLMNFEVQSRPVMTLLLVGHGTLLPELDRMPQIEERLAVKCLLRPLSLEETMGYVQHRLGAAGAEQAIFEPAAVERLHECTQGVPRRINRLADLALLLGYAEEQSSIGPAQVDAVAEELAPAAA